jgi:hypothetical protein
MDLNEIRNRITDLLYSTTAPLGCQGEVWKAIHEIEDQYKAEIAQLEQDRDAAVTANHSVRVCAKHTSDITDGEGCLVCDLEALKTEIEEARSALAADDNETLGEAAEHILAAARKSARRVEVKPEIINWSQLTKKHRMDEDSPEAWADFIIIAAMTKKCTRGEFHELFDLMERPTDRLEIAFTINDVQVPFMKVIQRFHNVVKDRVQSRLEEVLSERFSALDDFLDDAREAIRTAAQVKLGVKVTTREEED